MSGSAPAVKKPWRYYYIMGFPNSKSISKEKLVAMTEVTEAMTQKEEEYLQKMAARNAGPPPELIPSPLATWVALFLKYQCIGMILLMACSLGGIYYIYTADDAEDISQTVIYTATAIAMGVIAINMIGLWALHLHTIIGYRLLLVLLVLMTMMCAFAYDEAKTIHFTQKKLRGALNADTAHDITENDVRQILNGGSTPSLWRRFLFDGPAWFLRWLQQYCSIKSDQDNHDVDDPGLKLDSIDFFRQMYNSTATPCVEKTLERHLQVEAIAEPITIVCLVLFTMQIATVIVLLLTDNSASETRKSSSRKQKHWRELKQSASSRFWPLIRLLTFANAICGIAIASVSFSLMQSCAFAGQLQWILLAIGVYALAVIICSILTISQCAPRLVTCLLLLCVTAEIYSAAQTEIIRLELGHTNGAALQLLKHIYVQVSKQTCSVVVQWISHVCLSTNDLVVSGKNNSSVSGFDSNCQQEFATLLLLSVQFASSLLIWMIASHAVLLTLLLVPAIVLCVSTSMKRIDRSKCYSYLSTCTSYGSSPSQEEAIRDVKRWRKKPSLSFHEATELYLTTVRSKDAESLEKERQAFYAEWATMTGHDIAKANTSAVVFADEFEALVRTLVLRRLTTKCKLDASFSVSKDGTVHIAKLFASDNLLMTTLCEMDYKLKLTNAIDPGRSFWKNTKEVKNDLKILDQRTVKQKFKLLLLNNVISQKEAEQFPNESLSRVSARIHALTRIARTANGDIKCQNLYPPYAKYVPATHLQYLYKKYPNKLDIPGVMRKSSVLRTIDCLRITRHILDKEVDTSLMLQKGLLVSFHCLHSASRFDFNSRTSLSSAWITFWKPTHLPGEYDPETHWFRNQLGRWNPFRQPLGNVCDYFGESIAFYFAWMQTYGQLLVFPAIFVCLLSISQGGNDETMMSITWSFYHSKQKIEGNQPNVVVSPLGFGVGMSIIVWGYLFAKIWERRSVWYQLEWGTTRLGLNDKDRTNFRGKPQRDPVTHEMEIYFSGRARLQRQLMSSLLLTILAAGTIVVVLTLLLAQGVYAQWLDVRVSVLLSCFSLSLLMQWNGDVISYVSHQLSEWENYKNEAAFQQSVIAKVFALQLVNTYSGLFLLAFADLKMLQHTPFRTLYDTYQQRIGHVSVVVELQTLLLLIFLVRICSHLLGMTHSLLCARATSRSSSSAFSHVNADETESALSSYGGTYEDYTEIVMQFGLVVMFSTVFPLAPLLAFLECLLEIRLDAIDLCWLLQRPPPIPAEDIGLWTSCVQVLLKLSLITTFGFMFFTFNNHSGESLVQRLSMFVIAVLGSWLLSELFWFLVPNRTRAMEETEARNEFVIERYFGSSSQSSDNGAGGNKSDLQKHEANLLKSIGASNDSETLLPPDSSLEHFHERVDLLRRLNVALRKRDELHVVIPPVIMPTVSPIPDSQSLNTAELAEGSQFEEAETKSAYSPPSMAESEEQMIVGYIRRPPMQSKADQGRQEIPITAASPVQPTERIHKEHSDDPVVYADPSSVRESQPEQRLSVHYATQREEQMTHTESLELPTDVIPITQDTPVSTPVSRDLLHRESIKRLDVAKDDDSQRRSSWSFFSRKKLPSNESAKHASITASVSPPNHPILQLSGIDAVKEASRRSLYNFSVDDDWT